MESSFNCPTCGTTHEGLPTDHGWQLPDDVWAIPEPERSNKATFTSDLCQLGDRFFIRCLLELPFNEQSGYYGWGIRSEEHTSELQSLMRISYAVFCLKKKNKRKHKPIV